MDIGIFGGTFNPFHNGTLAVAKQARSQLLLTKVIFVPNGKPPHKKTGVLDKELRYQLLAAGIANEPGLEVSRTEIDRPGISWSIDTLREMKLTYGDSTRLNFIIGEDNVAAFEQYDLRGDFFKLCRLLIAPRQTPEQSHLEDWRKRLPEAEIVMINCQPTSISSSLIRALIASGADFSHLVPTAVHALIAENKHYLDSGLDLLPAA